MNPSSASGEVRFGNGTHSLSLPRGAFAACVEPVRVVPGASAETIIRAALAAPLGSPPLRELARGKRSAAILVPGRDRVAAVDRCLPLLLEELNAAGVADERIEVFLATGTHARHSAADAARVLGDEAVSRVRWHEHDCGDPSQLRHVGTTSYGTEVLFNRGVLDADIKVLTGRIIPHYFAGYGGGRKALLPGVAAHTSILQNHRLTLAPQNGLRAGVRPCSLKGNPVHLDMAEAARMAGSAFVLNSLLDTDHNVIGAVAGGLETAHEAGCAEAERIFKIAVTAPFDALVTSAGGAPYDCNFMQALKALFDVQEIVRPDGAILCVAQCPEGIKKGFVRWGAIQSDDELERAVRADYNLTGHNSIMLRRLLRKARVALWSELPDAEVCAMGIEPVHSLEDGVDWLQSVCPKRFRYAVIPHANVTYASAAWPGG